MIPESCEYLALVVVYAILVLSIFPLEAVKLVRSKQFWTSAVVFAVIWAAFDWAGIRLGMWRFSATRTLGIEIFQIPVEEFMVFFLIQLNTVSAWRTFQRGRWNGGTKTTAGRGIG